MTPCKALEARGKVPSFIAMVRKSLWRERFEQMNHGGGGGRGGANISLAAPDLSFGMQALLVWARGI